MAGLCCPAPADLPLWLKMPSISMLLLEWAMHREPQGTRPSAAGDRSVVRTRHQSGLSCGRSRTSTVWPRRMVSSLLLQAVKSWITTVSSQPPESWEGQKRSRAVSRNRWAVPGGALCSARSCMSIQVDIVLGTALHLSAHPSPSFHL